ncbi:hypothetical protein Avbf_03468 [Armadillidium vulgare]|nr:hypothetical protein Avbf_03468 [Armadillidium vulgare]
MENSLTDDNKLRLSHVLQKGINESKNYGLSLASSTFLPQAIIKRAYDVSANIEDSMKKNETPAQTDPNMAEEDAVYILAHRLLGFAASAPTKYISTQKTSPNRSTNNSTISTYSEDDENQLKELLKDMLSEFLTHPSQQ